jgi:hypothetical protein
LCLVGVVKDPVSPPLRERLEGAILGSA